MVRYALKKFCIVLSAFVIVFGCLQFSAVQCWLLNRFVNASFSSSTGFFPFDFSWKNLKLSGNGIAVIADDLHIALSRKLTHVKSILINKLDIKSPAGSKISPSDFTFLIPLVFQKIVKRAEIKSITAGDVKLQNVLLSRDRKLGIRCLEFSSPKGVFSASWRFEKNQIFANARFGDFSLQLAYDTKRNHINSDIAFKAEKIAFDGFWEDEKLKGLFTVSRFATNILAEISIENDMLKMHFRNRQLGVSGTVRFYIDTSTLYFSDISFDNGIRLNPFSIFNFSKIPELSVLFKQGKIRWRNIDFSDENFSLGEGDISEVALSQFFGDGVNGIISGSGHYKDGKERFKLLLQNFGYEFLKIPSIDIVSEHSKNATNVSVNFDFLKKKNKLIAKLFTSNWIITSDARIDTSFAGAFDIANHKLSSGQFASGKVEYKLTGTGSIAAPNIHGYANVKSGTYANTLLGTYIRDITLLCDLNNNSIDIKKIYARDDTKSKGQIRGKGQIRLENKKCPLTVSVKVDNFKVVEQNWLKGRLFGSLELKGNLLDEVNVSGTLFSKEPSVDVSGIVLLYSRSIEVASKRKKRVKSDFVCPIKFPVDVQFELKPEMKIHGFGVESSWNGGAKVTGNIFDIKCSANAKLREGSLNLTDSFFALKDGDISFDGDNFSVAVSAEKRIDKMTVGARFDLKNDVSKFSFYSSPYLAEKDIMSYILFDKPSSEISAGEGVALFSAMNKLSNGTDAAGFDVLGKFKTLFGIESISLKKKYRQLR